MALHGGMGRAGIIAKIGIGILPEFCQAVLTAEEILLAVMGMVQPGPAIVGTHATDWIDIFFLPVFLV
jgi:hypothetical protein